MARWFGWPPSFKQCVEIGERYLRSRQFADAGVEFLKAASVAPDRDAETEMLARAFACLEQFPRDVVIRQPERSQS